ncbi:MAG: phosphoglucosamine mutase [Acidobacteriota bacterium]
MERLFGTDGIRGKAGVYPLDDETLNALGELLAAPRRRILICWDTRESSCAIYTALAAGIERGGGEAVPGGTLPTPAASTLAQKYGFDAAVSVSASHNPFDDNGIKIFGPDGRKLPDEVESAIEERLGAARSGGSPGSISHPRPKADSRFLDDYVAGLQTHLSIARPIRIVVDCANGASSEAAHRLFDGLGASFVHDAPDGRNINRDCGSLHPGALQQRVAETGADLGAALDGDGDRAIFVDETGVVRDGDYTLFLVADHLHRAGLLRGNLVVTTVMANMGLDAALSDRGIGLAKTPVGDRYVLAEMDRRGSVLGGEQSGHTIRLDLQPAGDGLLTTIVVASLLSATDLPLSGLCAPMKKFPQVLLNVPVREKRDFGKLPAVRAYMQEVERRLRNRGRLVLRYSGTEMLARVMIEGEDQAEIEGMAQALAAEIRREVGVGP